MKYFSGIAGGLSAINFEIASGDNLHSIRSASILLATFIGGAQSFFGPILGAVIFVFFSIALSDYTKAWQLYLGAFFVLMVLYAPGGLAGMILTNLRVAKFGQLKTLRYPYAGILLGSLPLLLGLCLVIEMGYHLTLEAANGNVMKLAGFNVDTGSPETWAAAIGTLAVGAFFFEVMRRYFLREWHGAQERIEAQLTRGKPQ